MGKAVFTMKLGREFIPHVAISWPLHVAGFDHGGRADQNGCHMNRKTGTQHCH